MNYELTYNGESFQPSRGRRCKERIVSGIIPNRREEDLVRKESSFFFFFFLIKERMLLYK
jgi:hypothetical protein